MQANPCPFCGHNQVEIQVGTTDREGVPTAIFCEECGAVGPWIYEQPNGYQKALNLWNKRVSNRLVV